MTDDYLLQCLLLLHYYCWMMCVQQLLRHRHRRCCCCCCSLSIFVYSDNVSSLTHAAEAEVMSTRKMGVQVQIFRFQNPEFPVPVCSRQEFPPRQNPESSLEFDQKAKKRQTPWCSLSPRIVAIASPNNNITVPQCVH